MPTEQGIPGALSSSGVHHVHAVDEKEPEDIENINGMVRKEKEVETCPHVATSTSTVTIHPPTLRINTPQPPRRRPDDISKNGDFRLHPSISNARCSTPPKFLQPTKSPSKRARLSPPDTRPSKSSRTEPLPNSFHAFLSELPPSSQLDLPGYRFASPPSPSSPPPPPVRIKEEPKDEDGVYHGPTDDLKATHEKSEENHQIKHEYLYDFTFMPPPSSQLDLPRFASAIRPLPHIKPEPKDEDEEKLDSKDEDEKEHDFKDEFDDIPEYSEIKDEPTPRKEEDEDHKPEPDPRSLLPFTSLEEIYSHPPPIVLPIHGPPCGKCKHPSTLGRVSASNKNGNADRPYYRCQRSGCYDKWVTWADMKGVHAGNVACWCDRLSRENLTGRQAMCGPGKKFWVCAEGRCGFTSWVPVQEGGGLGYYEAQMNFGHLLEMIIYAGERGLIPR